jgi:nicotinate phosphoribosyltransferase
MHFSPSSPLYTDLYQLTMAQGYYLCGKHEEPAVFDYFFRKNPFDSGYTHFAGLADLLDAVESWRFSEEDLAYLRELGFDPRFLEYLRHFEPNIDVYAVREGEVVFPNEPVARFEGPLMQVQMLETLALNFLNFQSLIATKASRIVEMAGPERLVADFGLRRAQGLGGYHAARAAIIGGCQATSNVLAAKDYGLTPTGTLAHSWIQSFDSELEAFRAYARHYPESTVLLVDTYDTLRSGVPHAMTVAREMEAAGYRLQGIRLDSGDLAYLSKRARKMLDQEGLSYVKILASNQLDEYVIRSLLDQGAALDGFGVGTQLITGKPSAALDGVYKLSLCKGAMRMKLADNPEKRTLPGRKFLRRFFDSEGGFYRDGIFLEASGAEDFVYNPLQPDQFTDVLSLEWEDLLQPAMQAGRKLKPAPSLMDVQRYAARRRQKLPPEHRRLEFPHIYKVGVGKHILSSIATLTRQKEATYE